MKINLEDKDPFDYLREQEEMKNNKLYLAVNYGAYEGWRLERYDLVQQIIEVIKAGGTYGCEWKILKELNIKIEEDGNCGK